MNTIRFLGAALPLLISVQADGMQVPEGSLGIFEGRTDVGSHSTPGASSFEDARHAYTLSAAGSNMWFDKDDFHFLWRKLDGDVALAANIVWPTEGGNPHRKACLIIRQTLDADSAYADAVVHGDGLCSIQYRESQGDNTHEIQSNRTAPRRVRIEKRGAYVSMSIGDSAQEMKPAGGIFRIHFKNPFFVGLGVCAHDAERVETAIFSDVSLEQLAPAVPVEEFESTLETIAIQSTDRRVVLHTPDHIEAPNWTPDGAALIYNSRGGLYSIPAIGGDFTRIKTGTLTRLNNDHGISPDGKTLAISDQTKAGGSRIYTLPIEGGTPRLITEAGPSYWHGWSPDGKTLAFCGQRDGDNNIFTIPAAGGPETRLTTASGLDDGSDYSPDGTTIYFNSERRGTMQIWRMNVDGTDQKQVTSDEFNNWFPHPSPDGRWIAFLSYEAQVQGHPENQDVALRMMPTAGGPIKTLAKLYGGQGTINVPSWSPDSQRIAFVSYQPVYK